MMKPIAALALIISASSANAQIMEQKVISGWKGSAYYANGVFESCAIETGSTTGKEVLILIIGKSGLSLNVYNSSWELPTQVRYDTKITIDGEIWNGTARVTNNHRVTISLGWSDDWISAFRRSNRMALAIGEMRWNVNLNGTTAATTWLGSCYQRHSGGGTSNPFGPPTDGRAGARSANPFGEPGGGEQSPSFKSPSVDSQGESPLYPPPTKQKI